MPSRTVSRSSSGCTELKAAFEDLGLQDRPGPSHSMILRPFSLGFYVDSVCAVYKVSILSLRRNSSAQDVDHGLWSTVRVMNCNGEGMYVEPDHVVGWDFV